MDKNQETSINENSPSSQNDKENLGEEHNTTNITSDKINEVEKTPEDKIKELEDKIKELEDKLARTFAEMENQRRRFEKEKEDAFEYGGFLLAKETLNLIDNLER